jgi:hypothetical protein
LLAAVAARSLYFKLRAEWAKEDPPRPDFHLTAETLAPALDLAARERDTLLSASGRAGLESMRSEMRR